MNPLFKLILTYIYLVCVSFFAIYIAIQIHVFKRSLMFTKLSQVLASACWVFVLAGGWLMLVGTVTADAKAWVLLGFFFMAGVMAGAVASGKAKTQ